MIVRHFVIATAGHVDHGKSALVEALTGMNPDRLPEEKARNITIELGFTHFDLLSEAAEKLRIGIVDVPGHEDFVRNMIAGVGSIDLALLIVAAGEGWMPQTEEHFQILNYLGVTRAIVVVTKADLGGVEKTIDAIRAQLLDTSFSKSPIVATSARTGTGLDELRRTLVAEFSRLPSPKDVNQPRLFVDRAFTIRGVGTVVTGTLAGGSIKCGETVTIQPRRLKSRVRSLQSYGEDIQLAQPGMRTALNLSDLPVGKSDGGIGRGDIVTTGDLVSTDTLDVLIQRSSRFKSARGSKLKNGVIIDLHHGTTRVPATVVLLDSESLGPGDHAVAQLRTPSPVYAFLGDRLILRDRSQQHTLAGAVVLDPDGDRRRFRTESQQRLLRERATGWSDPAICVVSEIARAGARRASALLSKSSFSSTQIADSLGERVARGLIVRHGVVCATPDHWKKLKDQAIAMIDAIHRQNPEQPGLELNRLRSSFRDQPPEFCEELITHLCAHGFVRAGETIARTSHHAALPRHLEEIATRILAALAEKPFDPPAVKQIASGPPARQTLKFLIKTKAVAEISPDVVLKWETFERMKSAIENHIRQQGAATVSALRQELQTSRRVIVPLLERLDREGFTRRVGDQRILAH